ncbi:hypothetical protein LEMLEM_LOCUS6399 [Lemmus lemmus]
MLGKDW